MTKIALQMRSCRLFRRSLLTDFFLVLFIASFITPAKVQGDGMFVAPKFVWDKHKDINEPTQKAILVYDAGREDLILQVKYEGPVEEFGWLIPVPNLPTVQKGSMKCFYELSQYTQRLWEPPVRASKSLGIMDSANSGEEGPPPPVKVIEIKTIGAYEVAVLSTKDAGALENWLDANHFYFPTNRTDVLDSYIKQQWYLVVVKINLGKSDGFQLVTESPKGRETPKSGYATVLKLANGELYPLQISFVSDRCVFPLKISSVNGKPSEVQVYVLSPEPLLEKTMLEKKLPLIYSNDVARAKRSAQQFERMQLMQRNMQMRFMGGAASTNLPLSVEGEKAIQRNNETPVAGPDELLPYAKVTKADLPDSSKWIPRLADKSWWLTKQTWTFKPDEMRDLEFEPAIPYFVSKLDSKYAYFAAARLTPFGSDSVLAIIAAMQSANPTIRVNATTAIFEQGVFPIHDARLTEAALIWLKDSEWRVRVAAVEILTDYSNWHPETAKALIAMLRDEDAGVRHSAMSGLAKHGNELEKYIPDFQQMLVDTNPGIRASGLEILTRLQVLIPREQLLPFFKSSDPEAIGETFSQFRGQGEKISDGEVIPLLQNSLFGARLMGLRVLDQNPEKQSIELALPLLRDPDELVRVKAAQTLRALTGQHFRENQADEWGKWWTENKTNLVVQLHPEELRPQLPTGNTSWHPPLKMPPDNLSR